MKTYKITIMQEGLKSWIVTNPDGSTSEHTITLQKSTSSKHESHTLMYEVNGEVLDIMELDGVCKLENIGDGPEELAMSPEEQDASP